MSMMPHKNQDLLSKEEKWLQESLHSLNSAKVHGDKRRKTERKRIKTIRKEARKHEMNVIRDKHGAVIDLAQQDKEMMERFSKIKERKVKNEIYIHDIHSPKKRNNF